MKATLPEGQIGTLANVITVTGAALVAKGIETGVDTPQGLALVTVGRACDLVDGRTARSRGEDSDLGSLLDASVDKVGCAAIAYSMWRKDIIPDVVFAGMVAQNGANGIFTAKAQKANPGAELRPSYTGKFAMFAQNVGIIAYAASHNLSAESAKIASAENPDEAKIAKLQNRAKAARMVGHVASVIGVVGLGIPATMGYRKRSKIGR